MIRLQVPDTMCAVGRAQAQLPASLYNHAFPLAVHTMLLVSCTYLMHARLLSLSQSSCVNCVCQYVYKIRSTRGNYLIIVRSTRGNYLIIALLTN